MRIFYAVNFDDSTAAELKALQDGLRGHVRAGRWAPVGNLHMTLHFVGEIEDTELPEFRSALDTAAAASAPFSVRFTSYGSFRQGRQDLIYIKAKSTADSLGTISAVLKDRLQRGDMKEFRPHITLVRRAEINYSTLKVLKKQRFSLPPVEIKTIELMQSRKRDGKLVYIPLHSARLGE